MRSPHLMLYTLARVCRQFGSRSLIASWSSIASWMMAQSSCTIDVSLAGDDVYPSGDIIKAHITNIYRACLPSKLPNVDRMLAMYQGEELLVYHTLCEKFNIRPQLPQSYTRLSDVAAPGEPMFVRTKRDEKASYIHICCYVPGALF